jgi:hypothetical protein
MQTPASAQPATTSPAPPAPPASPDLPAPPPPPALAPAAPGAQDAFPVSVQQIAVPRTAAEVSALRARGSELSRQLNSATGRRESIARDLRRADGADQAGLEQRLTQLDQRILGIEADIAANGRLLAAAPPNLLASTRESSAGDAGPLFLGGLGSGQVTAISIVFIIFVLAPMAAAYARRLWHRPARTPQTAAALESQQRLERMEQAVDAIAIEVERVSESQRFLTRILTEAHDLPALGARAGAEPVPVRATAVGATTP